jgi:hypothetical protein
MICKAIRKNPIKTAAIIIIIRRRRRRRSQNERNNVTTTSRACLQTGNTEFVCQCEAGAGSGSNPLKLQSDAGIRKPRAQFGVINENYDNGTVKREGDSVPVTQGILVSITVHVTNSLQWPCGPVFTSYNFTNHMAKVHFTSARSCEHGNELPVSTKDREFLYQLSDSQFFKTDSPPRSYLLSLPSPLTIHNEKLHNLYASSDIIRMMRWA